MTGSACCGRTTEPPVRAPDLVARAEARDGDGPRVARDERRIPAKLERYVVVVHGIQEDEAKVLDLLRGLHAEDVGWFTGSLAVPRSRAVEAYRRILNSPYRDRGVLVPWDQEPFLSRP